MKGKSTFTLSEAKAIIALIRQKLLSCSIEQKKIRKIIRDKGFYASDFGIGGGYTEYDFLRVVKIVEDVSESVSASTNVLIKQNNPVTKSNTTKRQNSDESYIIGLCDEVLKLTASKQHRFDFLRGDAGTPLPVDAFYPSLNLVIEFREKQHTEEVKFFNRRETVSGVNRGEQRKIYDQRRRDILPQHNITLIEFGYDEFEHNRSKQLFRNKENDIEIIRKKVKTFIKV